MKRLVFTIILIMAGCRLIPNAVTPMADPPSLNAFEFSNRCPHICWLGINPGVTTPEDANARLSIANDIDQSSLRTSSDEATAIWFANSTHTQFWHVGISFDQGFVTSISFDGGTHPFRLGDMIGFLGKPDDISIRLIEEPDARYLDEYTVIYHDADAALLVSPDNSFGPAATDRVKILLMNTAFGNVYIPEWLAQAYETRQPWLGYRHLKEYLPGQNPPPIHNNPLGP
jgi:hypothetical protein